MSVGFGISDHLVKVTSSVAKAGMMKEVLLKWGSVSDSWVEERTSGPLLPLMVEIEGGVENSGQFNYHCSVWPLLEAGVMTHHASQAMHGVVMSGRKQPRHCVMEEW